MLRLDSFGTPISFNYENGSSLHTTVYGSCLSILVILVTFTFLTNNLSVMATYTGSIVSTSTVDSYLSANDTFTQDDGFRMAVGLKGGEDFADYLELSVKILSFDYTASP